MGRIHRYGQQRDVHVFNLVASNTREGKVLEKLFKKLKEMEKDLGNKVFDVIGEIFPDKNLYELIVSAVMQTKSLEEIERELEVKLDKEHLERLRRDVLEEALATRNIDYTRLAENYERAKENRLVPEYVEEWFKRAFEKFGGKVKERKDGFLSIEKVPYDLRERAEQNKQVVKKEYPKATFDKEKAFKNPEVEFISFGHPLLENLIDLVLERYKEKLLNGAVFEDPSGKLEGFLWLFEGEVSDGTGKIAGKKLFCIHDNGKELSPINLNILWDLVPVDEGTQVPTYNIDERRKKAEELFYELINQYKEEILKERERQARVKQKYGVRSLKKLIYDLGLEINEFEERKERGEKNLESKITQLKERRESYERALEELQDQIQKEKKLTYGAPKLLGIFYVRPVYKKGLADEEVERIGMEITMAYERSQGREPVDVSKENLGYDIRSEGKGEVRYIEVKARSDESYVELTMNEYLKARQLKEKYWLYVVCNAQTSPTLYIINNPAEKLKMDKRVVDVRYVVPPEEWKEKGERHEEVH
jgi:Superfamily II DNA/RNA helicases, SNF2 family